MLIKKIIILPIIVVLFSNFAFYSFSADISAESCVLINAETKEIMYEKNAYEKRSMASTTKIMTSILAVESGKMNDIVTVTSDALAEGTSIGLKEGYILTLESLTYGMMLESGNDAANVCAIYLGGTTENFAVMMNTKGKEIGMTRTNFVTPSGLDDEEHYSTAYDMALLGAYCIKNPVFREICSDKSQKIDFIKPDITVNFSNHNRLLNSCEGVFGIKTGFTKKSGRCLVSACEREGATLVCVTLNAADDWNDHRKLYDLTFTELNKSTVKPAFERNIPVYGADTKELEIYCDDFDFYYKNDSELTEQIILPEIIYAPIDKNEILGKINYYLSGELIHTSYIYSRHNVPSSSESYKNKKTFIERIKDILFRKDD